MNDGQVIHTILKIYELVGGENMSKDTLKYVLGKYNVTDCEI